MPSLKVLPAENEGTVLAVISIGSPVRGFRPLVAALLVTLKVPNPEMATGSSFFRLSVITWKTASRAFLALSLLKDACSAIF